MKWIACLAVAALGCQNASGDKPASGASVQAAPTGSAYAKDIESLCEAVTRSGADQLAPEAHMVTIANWLAVTLETAESKAFLVKIQPLVGDAKADALDSEARRVGLKGCALAGEWRTP